MRVYVFRSTQAALLERRDGILRRGDSTPAALMDDLVASSDASLWRDRRNRTFVHIFLIRAIIQSHLVSRYYVKPNERAREILHERKRSCSNRSFALVTG